MFDLNLFEAFDELNRIYEAEEQESKYISVSNVDLSKSRMVDSDKVDVRGEVESSAVIPFTPKAGIEPVLSRIAAYVFIVRKTEDGLMFLAKRKKRRLPGGGFDKNKDSNLMNTVSRETLEETGIKIKDIKDIDCAFWHAESNTGFEAGWVNKHIANEEDRHHGYYERYYIAKYDSGEINKNAEEGSIFDWYPISVAEKSKSINKIIYDKAKSAGYLDESIYEDVDLTEGKQVGQLSYGVASVSSKTANGGRVVDQSSLDILAKILETEKIKATRPDPKSKFDSNTLGFNNQVPYVSFSRDLLSHIGNQRWPVGIIINGDKLSDKYKIKPIDHAYNVLATPKINSDKTIEIMSMSIYENADNPSDKLYRVTLGKQQTNTGGSIFVSKSLFDVLHEYLNLNNTLNTPPKSDKYGSDRSWGDAHGYTEKELGKNGITKISGIQKASLPVNQRNKNWVCIFEGKYNSQNGVKLNQKSRDKYAEILKDRFGVDVSSNSFVVDLLQQGQVSEAEERVLLKAIQYDDNQQQIDQFIDISGTIEKIVLPEKYKKFIESKGIDIKYVGGKTPYMTKNNEKRFSPLYKTLSEQEQSALKRILDLSNRLGCEFKFYNDNTTNHEVK